MEYSWQQFIQREPRLFRSWLADERPEDDTRHELITKLVDDDET